MRLDSFLKLEGQKGLSSDGSKAEAGSHFEEFEILTFHHRIHRGKDGGELVDGLPANPVHGEISLIQPLDTNIGKLLDSVNKHKEFASAKITVRGMSGAEPEYKDLYTLTAERAVLTRVHYAMNSVFHSFGREGQVQASLTDGSAGPLVEVELLYFGSITWKYETETPQTSAAT